MPRRYAVLDVFTDRPLAGNQLAVVLDSDGLDDARMQAIAGRIQPVGDGVRLARGEPHA